MHEINFNDESPFTTCREQVGNVSVCVCPCVFVCVIVCHTSVIYKYTYAYTHYICIVTPGKARHLLKKRKQALIPFCEEHKMKRFPRRVSMVRGVLRQLPLPQTPSPLSSSRFSLLFHPMGREDWSAGRSVLGWRSRR